MTRRTDDAAVWRSRLDRLLPSVFLVALAFVQRPGWTAADTKLDLVVDPAGFLGRALSLWDPLAAGGQLQNQAYGYLFPMGPFFLLGDALRLPGWVVQRLWWALVLVLAYHGARRVLERLGVGTGWSRVVGAFTYALAPRMLVGLGAISSEIWPMAVAPWVLLPLLAVRPGDERSAALRSGVAVLALGAVNAVASLATLVLPAWWILTRRGRPRRLLLGWWSVAVVLASAWWVGPLVLLGRYSPPFLDWIEDARVTTSVASVTEALRGTTQWIATIGGSQAAVWPAGWVVLTSRNVVLLGLVVVLAGLLGLALARGPWAGFARGGLLLGLVLVTFGHLGGVAPPWAGAEADLLDRALAPFRNTHKFEPVVRLPLALGVAHALPLAVTWLRSRGAPWPALAPALVVTALVGQTAVPAALGVVQRGPFVAVPAAWSETARWLADHDDGGRTLLLPGGNAPARFWGEPKDEPLQPYAESPWVVRDAVPLGSAGATRILNAVETRVAQGRGGEELRALLEALAVTRVVVVADHARPGAGTTPPVVVRAALVRSGATSVAAFGDVVGGSTDVAVASDWGLDRPLRELEVLDVGTGSRIAPTERVPLATLARYAGGPEGATALPAAGAGVLTTEPGASAAAGPVVVTDTLQRRRAGFATATDLYGPLRSADEDYRSARAVHDYWPAPLGETSPGLTDAQTVRVDDGEARADASSSLAEPALGQGRELASDPWRAFDLSGETAWTSSGFSPEGQWLGLTWAEPLLPPASVEVVLDTERGADVAALTVTTDAGTLRTPVTTPSLAGDDVDPERYRVAVEVPPGPTTGLRLEVAAVRDGGRTVRVRDVGAGVLPRTEPAVRLPVTELRPDVVTLGASGDDRPACHPLANGVLACSPGYARTGEEATQMRRVVRLEEARTFEVTGSAVATGVGADALLRRLDGVRASGSSRWLTEPGVSPQLVVDGDPGTYWAADPDDERPTLTVRWPGRRTVEGLRLTVASDVAGRRPTAVEVTLGGRTVRRVLDRDGVVDLPTTRTDRVRVVVTDTTSQDALTAAGRRPMPVVVGDVALLGDPWPVGPTGEDPVVVPCGLGPTVQAGGVDHPTSVEGTRADVLGRADLSLRVCAPVALGAGEQRVQTLASGQLAVRSLVLDARPDRAPSPASTPVRVLRWESTSRTVDVGTARDVDTVVVVRENANAGWTARAGGTELRPVRVDGWAQGWVVPAGVSGPVDLVFGPQRLLVLSLGLGAVLAASLVALAARSGRRRGAPVLEAATAPGAAPVLVVVALTGVGGVVGAVAAGAALLARRLPAAWVAPVAGAASLGWLAWAAARPWPHPAASNRDLVSGVLALLLVALACTRRRRGAGPPRRTLRRGPVTGPGLDGGLDEVPAQGRHDDRHREGEEHRDPEAPLEDVETQHLADPEHERQVPEEDAVADRPAVDEDPRRQDP
ncbi:DUF3367 domain-containing protein [Phycicoccus sp. BSK3Z-2]|uniref:DUF3367 domain-containing protein n=1 Tax=Phycicoccus avicenniae TaxID=2828860 RepID=A0A941D806_9MICO|nr:DUF3367 domain-containing protein [Phycicoccus avicenniae]